jgi:hypothetical protein
MIWALFSKLLLGLKKSISVVLYSFSHLQQS